MIFSRLENTKRFAVERRANTVICTCHRPILWGRSWEGAAPPACKGVGFKWDHCRGFEGLGLGNNVGVKGKVSYAL